MTTLRQFVILKKLKVHNLLIETKRVRADYTVYRQDGSSESNQLIYRYDKPFFLSDRPADRNLASMMMVQVALNYGLFCEEIEFEGDFDEVDRRFLEDMLENTSREIYVNKLLIDNVFLLPAFRGVEAVRMDRYTAARLTFSRSVKPADRKKTAEEETDLNDYAILSSGGKDSLLTYGLIKEIGKPHPVFINESGRHWFTAVNSYRKYQSIEPNTVKPWCNSDRIFNWMLHQLPFIRRDYATIRADYYPVRLWTVAVFLFGVLPVVRKRKIGNILVGNEYDTTIKGNAHGISHYSGLYDQSKYFDNMMTRYYHRKGWHVYQYSILRSISELLILKVLVKRYPDLQREQVSCHAAHEKDGRMYPCGRCEKCRRIIGMLKALDEDPARCGYTPEQIRAGLHALEDHSIKQLGSDAQQLYYMLMQKGLLATTPHTKKLARPHEQILELRFDQERSNLADMPVHIRKALFEILKHYTDKAVKMTDRKWHPYELDRAIEEVPYFLTEEQHGK